MLERIPIYELPFGKEGDLAFKIYRVQGAQINRKDYPHKTQLPHKHNYYELCFFTDGGGMHEIDFKTYPIVAPSIHFLKPGQVHLIRRGEQYKGYLIVFSEEFFILRFQNMEIIPGYPLIAHLADGPVLKLDKSGYEKFHHIIEDINQELENNDTDTEEIIIAYLKLFFLKLRQNFSKLVKTTGNPQGSTKQIVYRFNQLVDQYHNQIHHVKEYAELLGDSPIRLNRAVKEVTGETASEIIIKRLILEAKRLLLYSELSNKEIAYKLNYEDPSYFSRIFRKKAGYSPSAFREAMRGRYNSNKQ